MSSDYATWLHNKTDETRTVGLTEKDIVLLDKMFPHEKALTTWALRRGSAAIFADTGLAVSRFPVARADDRAVCAPSCESCHRIEMAPRLAVVPIPTSRKDRR